MSIFKIKKKILKTVAKNLPWARLRITLFRKCGYIIGKDVYIAEGLIIAEKLDTQNNLVIEDRVAIGPGVILLTSSDPNLSRIRPFVKSVRGSIRIERDAWIGAGVIILPNVTIGEGAVVGAGSVVIKDIQPYTINVGIPAKLLRKLDMEHEDII